MTRDGFLRALRLGLAGLPADEIEDIVGDYAAYFAESHASGRSEDDVVAALGDPTKLARDLRAEAGLRRFEAHASLANLFAALLALVGLALVDIFFLLPILVITIIVTLGVAIALLALAGFGLKIIIVTLLFHHSTFGAVSGSVLIGVGLVCCLFGGGALLLLGLAAGIKVLGRYARLHLRIAQPSYEFENNSTS